MTCAPLYPKFDDFAKLQAKWVVAAELVDLRRLLRGRVIGLFCQAAKSARADRRALVKNHVLIDRSALTGSNN